MDLRENKMTDLQNLIDTANKLSATLERLAENERKFGFEICHKLEILSWEMYRSAGEIKQIYEYIRG